MEKEITLVLNYLDKIGEKLGIGANMLWPYMMKQQVFEAYINMAIMGLMAIVCLLTWSKYAKNPHRHDHEWKDGMYFYSITMGASAAITVIGIGIFIFRGIYQLVNTEYMAFKALLELVGKVR